MRHFQSLLDLECKHRETAQRHLTTCSFERARAPLFPERLAAVTLTIDTTGTQEFEDKFRQLVILIEPLI
jgi:hypothetical protein